MSPEWVPYDKAESIADTRPYGRDYPTDREMAAFGRHISRSLDLLGVDAGASFVIHNPVKPDDSA